MKTGPRKRTEYPEGMNGWLVRYKFRLAERVVQEAAVLTALGYGSIRITPGYEVKEGGENG